jgi:hypothetical protein
MSVTRASVAPCTTLALALLVTPLAAQQNLPLPARDNALTERPTTVFNVGAEEGESWEMFSGIRALAFDKADNLYVLDGMNFRVLVFDRSGRFVRQFGKKGGGPGELQTPLGLAVLADGNIAVTDLTNRGYVIYRADGTYVRNVTFADDEGMGMPFGRIEADPKGGIVTRANTRMTPRSEVSGPNYAWILRQPIPTAAVTGTTTSPTTPAPTQLYRVEIPAPRIMDQAPGRRMVMMVETAFGPRPTFGVLPDGGVAVHHETEYAVKLLDPTGRHTRTLTRAIQPRKVTKKDQEAELERRKNARANAAGTAITVAVGGGGGRSVTVGPPSSSGGPGRASPERLQPNLEDIPFADHMAVVTNLRTDPLGRIWVQRRHQDGSNQGPIDLVTSAGKYIGTLPAQPLPDAVSASGLAAYIVRDDLGVERVSVRRLPASWR